MKQTITWVIIALVVVGGFFWYVSANKVPSVDAGPSKYDSFAQCLAQKEITMYGAVWCPHCQAQKKEFDNSGIIN